jgi:(1->4)-alpha-D-glucan 1-alpha-D-glucosylmutase
MGSARVPTGTYRLQLHREFTFCDAAAIVPYLADLGVSHVYCSPILQATPGSTHGYDVVDHTRLNDELGGAEGWRALVDACRAHGLGIVVDIVPNHMAIPNAHFTDVLANGRDSPYAHWFDIDWAQRDRTTGELSYRRFFDVTSLIALRVEQPEVFAATHELIGELLHAGDIDGLRVDHPDGLADPRGYLEQLEKLCGGVWTVVEKILEDGEQLPHAWACDGTTGYDTAAAVTRVLVDPAGAGPLTVLYAEYTGTTASYDEVVVASKRLVIDELFGAEIARLARDRPREAVVEMLVHFPVYRSYDGAYVDEAATAAKQARPDLADGIDHVAAALHHDLAFATRFGQTSGPVTAKGVEDTAFYRYARLLALNEVGGNPGRFGGSVDEFHAFCSTVAQAWPATMTTLSTHDTKRSEDVRARLAVLAEIPAEWAAAVRGWRDDDIGDEIDGETEYVFWQTLVGASPISADRVDAFMRKAVREAKLHTSWLDPNPDYEQRLSGYVHAVLADNRRTAAVERWTDTYVAAAARSNTLAQKLIQLTMPGVPDVYQGQELPDFSLVDPDNRRPVDYDLRRDALVRLDDPKLLVTTRALQLRRERPNTFAGSYRPLTANEHVVAFVRDDDVVTVATRLPVGLRNAGGWSDARIALPPGRWRDVLTDRRTDGSLATMLDALPVALLTREADQ